MAAVTAIVIAWALKPWRHGGFSRSMVDFLLVIAVLLFAFVALGKQYFTPSPANGDATSKHSTHSSTEVVTPALQ